jgi:hypothetical protein
VTGRLSAVAAVTPDVTRFDADTPRDRRKLFAAAVTAHRTRGSPFLTVEADPASLDDVEADAEAGDGGGPGSASDASGEAAASPDSRPPWLQFGENTVNLDCTDAELDRLTSLLDAYPEFRIDQMESPEAAEGTNVKITARSDANRLADFFDSALREVYGLPDDYRAWVVEL